MTIDGQVIGRVNHRNEAEPGSAPVTARRFDLDDVGAQVAHHHRAEGPCEYSREVQDSYAFKGQSCPTLVGSMNHSIRELWRGNSGVVVTRAT